MKHVYWGSNDEYKAMASTYKTNRTSLYLQVVTSKNLKKEVSSGKHPTKILVPRIDWNIRENFLKSNYYLRTNRGNVK